MKIVRVTWLDAQCELDDLPQEVSAELQPLRRQNIGILINEDAKVVRIAYGLIENEDKEISAYDNPLIIPRGMILDIEIL